MAETSGLPLDATMANSIEYMKKAWSGFNLPNHFAPTMDVEELDRRIKDLKAVEQWLAMNLGLLKNTIQGLEIQRGAIATVAAFSQAFHRSGGAMADLAQRAREPNESAAAEPTPNAASPTSRIDLPLFWGSGLARRGASDNVEANANAAAPPAANAEAAAPVPPENTPLPSAATLFSELSRLGALAGFGGFSALGQPAAADAPPAAAADSAAEAAPDPTPDPAPGPAPDSTLNPASVAHNPQAQGDIAESMASNASNAWWNLLQGQFNQIVSAATSPSLSNVFGGLPGASPSAGEAAPPSTEPASQSPSKTASHSVKERVPGSTANSTTKSMTDPTAKPSVKRAAKSAKPPTKPTLSATTTPTTDTPRASHRIKRS